MKYALVVAVCLHLLLCMEARNAKVIAYALYSLRATLNDLNRKREGLLYEVLFDSYKSSPQLLWPEIMLAFNI